jgi:hypothetical protein
MHTKGKSVDDATQFFMKECGSPEPEARREALRGTRDSGYINYTVGKLEILKLREDYRAKMGDKFSLTDFHDLLLAGGLGSDQDPPPRDDGGRRPGSLNGPRYSQIGGSSFGDSRKSLLAVAIWAAASDAPLSKA